MHEVATILSKHFGQQIIIESNEIKNVGFNSVFQDEELLGILEIIKLTLDIDYEIHDNKIVLKAVNNDQRYSENN